MQLRVGLCGHCQLGHLFVCKDGPVFTFDAHRAAARGAGAVMRRPRNGRRSRSGSSPPATAASSRCSTCEDELLALADEIEIAYFLEARRRDGRGALRPLAGRGLDHHAGGRRADPDGARAVAAARDHRGVRHGGRHPGAAQLRRRGGVPLASSTPRPEYIVDARDLHADRATTCTSTSSCTAARSTSASCSR